MSPRRTLWSLWLAGLMLFCAAGFAAAADVLPGIEVLAREYPDALAGKRVGILTNPTGVDLNLTSTIERVRALPGVEVMVLFAPEHGLRGGVPAGEQFAGAVDALSGLPVVSLYGESKDPPAQSLRGLDAVLYDMQDVGHRTYTFISTMARMMDACAREGVAFWVLDRPEPMGGEYFGGPMLDPDLQSFIGAHNIPQVYGLTPGEFARLYQRERVPALRLCVVAMKGWRRGMNYGDLGWLWVPPSEHIPRWESSYFYAMTGTLGELGAAGEGVGTPLPFEQIGAPWIDGPNLAGALNAAGLPGVAFRPALFRPRYGALQGQTCSGAQIHLIDSRACQPARVSHTILVTLARLYPERKPFQPSDGEAYGLFLKALGSRRLAQTLAGEIPLPPVEAEMAQALEAYGRRRAEILIYP